MTDLQRLLGALIPVAGLVGCVGVPPQHTPPLDPPGEYVALTKPIIALGDTQEHEATGFPLHDNDGAVDSYVEVAQRPPAQPLFGRRILEWAIQSHPDAPGVHTPWGEIKLSSYASRGSSLRRWDGLRKDYIS